MLTPRIRVNFVDGKRRLFLPSQQNLRVNLDQPDLRYSAESNFPQEPPPPSGPGILLLGRASASRPQHLRFLQVVSRSLSNGQVAVRVGGLRMVASRLAGILAARSQGETGVVNFSRMATVLFQIATRSDRGTQRILFSSVAGRTLFGASSKQTAPNINFLIATGLLFNLAISSARPGRFGLSFSSVRALSLNLPAVRQVARTLGIISATNRFLASSSGRATALNLNAIVLAGVVQSLLASNGRGGRDATGITVLKNLALNLSRKEQIGRELSILSATQLVIILPRGSGGESDHNFTANSSRNVATPPEIVTGSPLFFAVSAPSSIIRFNDQFGGSGNVQGRAPDTVDPGTTWNLSAGSGGTVSGGIADILAASGDMCHAQWTPSPAYTRWRAIFVLRSPNGNNLRCCVNSIGTNTQLGITITGSQIQTFSRVSGATSTINTVTVTVDNTVEHEVRIEYDPGTAIISYTVTRVSDSVVIQTNSVTVVSTAHQTFSGVGLRIASNARVNLNSLILETF